MLCSHPFRKDGCEFGCGQCLPCRFNKRRVWTSRLMLESYQHEASSFATLTFNQENYPVDGSLSVRTAQLFVKRVRALVYPTRLRYFLVGEYGDSSGRPHYHVALFGLRQDVPLEECWKLGFIQTLDLSRFLAQYLCGYAVKKMTRREDPRLAGRVPEFARMSLKPGIGAGAIASFKKSVIDPDTGEILIGEDVPGAFRLEKKLWPMGRYLMQQFRMSLGMEKGVPPAAADMRRVEELVAYPTWRDREKKEDKRRVDAERARVRDSIARSRKGI